MLVRLFNWQVAHQSAVKSTNTGWPWARAFSTAATLQGCHFIWSEDRVKTNAPKPPTSKSVSAKEAKAQAPAATAINEPAGKIASVNPALRFVVIDFGLNRVPQTDQRLGIYRQGQKVGEIKISNQARNSIIAADITAGEAQVGDEVRP